jgi:hypothetical protein
MRIGVALLVLLAPFLAPGCAATLDHQAELLLHPEPLVQAPALVGSLPGTLVSLPVWGAVALVDGPEGAAAGYALHIFAWPGSVILGGIPWLIVGASWEQAPPEETDRTR